MTLGEQIVSCAAGRDGLRIRWQNNWEYPDSP